MSLDSLQTPYDTFVMNKTIDGKQMTIGWHVDDLKISHVDKNELENIIAKLEAEFGKETPLTVHRGKVHDYLGMIIDFSPDPGKANFSMHECIECLLDEASAGLMKAPALAQQRTI